VTSYAFLFFQNKEIRLETVLNMMARRVESTSGELNRTSSGSCPMARCHINDVESLGSKTVLVKYLI
jgi:uncharacterized protein Yka (UPF0111/DUF47 family)